MPRLRRGLLPASLLAASLVAVPHLAAQTFAPKRGDWDCYEALPMDPVSLTFAQAPLSRALRTLAEYAREKRRLNILIPDGEEATVTARFDAAPFRQVFRALVEGHDLECVRDGSVLRVRSTKQLTSELTDRINLITATRTKEAELRIKEAESRSKEAESVLKEAISNQKLRDAGRGLGQTVIRLQYADAQSVADTLEGILGIPRSARDRQRLSLSQLPGYLTPPPPTTIPDSPPLLPLVPGVEAGPADDAAPGGLTIQAHQPTNSIFIRYYESELEGIVKLVKTSLDIPLPQVQIAAQMVITALTSLQQIGVQWGGAAIRSVGDRTALVGSGFAQGPVRTGPGTPVVGQPTNNPGFPGSQFLPVDPSTGLPVGGSIVNLPTSLLPTVLGATPAGGLLLGIIGQNFALDLAIQALEVQGKARTLAEPKVVTVENAKGVIARGFEVPFTSTPTQGVQNVQFKDALLKLEVTPRVIRDNGEIRIRMKVMFENNEPDFSRSVLTGGNPPIFKRRQETDVLVRQGERLVIGGVTNELAANTYRKVPWLGDLPYLGWLFKSRETNETRDELIVILTPTVLSDPAPRTAR